LSRRLPRPETDSGIFLGFLNEPRFVIRGIGIE